MPLLTPRVTSRRGGAAANKDFYPASTSSTSSQSTEFTLNSIRAVASARLRKAASAHTSVPGNANINIINSSNCGDNNITKRTMSSVKVELRTSSKHLMGRNHYVHSGRNKRGDRARSGISEYSSGDSERSRSGLGIFTKKSGKGRTSSTTSGSFPRLTLNPRSESSFGRLTLRGTTRKVDPKVPYKATTDKDVRGYEKIGGGKRDDAFPRKKSGVILPTEQQLREHKPKGGVIQKEESDGKSGGRYTPKGWNEAAQMGGRFLSFDQPHTTDLADHRTGGGGDVHGDIARFISFDEPGSTKNKLYTGVSPLPLQTERISSFDAAPKTIQFLPPSRPMAPLHPKVAKVRQPQSLRDFGKSLSSRIEPSGDSAVASRKSSIKRISGRIQRKQSIKSEQKGVNADGKEGSHVHLSHRIKATTSNDLCGVCGHCRAENWPDDQTAVMTEDGRFYLNEKRISKYDEFTSKVGFCTAFWLIQRPETTLDRATALRWGLLGEETSARTLYRPLIRLFLADRDEHGFVEGQYYATTDISSPSRRNFSKIHLHTLTLESFKVLVEWARRVRNPQTTPQFETRENITAVNALDAIDKFCRDHPGRVVGPLPKNSRRLA